MFLVSLFLVAGSAVQSPASTTGEATVQGAITLELPEGPAAEVWRRARNAKTAAEVPSVKPWPRWPEDWSAPAPWKRWEKLITETSPTREFELALLARAQGRDATFWESFAETTDPGLLRALVQSAFEARVVEDVLWLAPPLPPPDPTEPDRPFVGREYSYTLSAPTSTRLRVTVKIEPDGTQVDLEHAGGPPVDVALTLPVRPAHRITVCYADWARQDDPAVPLRFGVEATEDGAKHEAWGRYLPAPRHWPRALPTKLSRGVQAAGFELVWEGDAPPPAYLAQARASYARLLGTEVRLVRTIVPGSKGAPLRLHLGPESGPKTLDLFGLVERWARRLHDASSPR